MNSIIPLLYSLILFVSLILIFFYLVGQFQVNLKVENRLTALEKKLQENKKSSAFSYKLGQLYLRKKVYDKAIQLFRNSLKYWDFNDKLGLGSLYNTLGFTYFKLKQYEDAAYYYCQAIRLLPDYTLALTNLGLVYESQEKYKEAYEIYNQALIFDSTNETASSRLPSVKSKKNLIN